MDNSERRHLFRALRRAGWSIGVGGTGHYKLLAPDGEFVTTIPATPSDHRARRNAIAALRRAGFAWPTSKRRNRTRRASTA